MTIGHNLDVYNYIPGITIEVVCYIACLENLKTVFLWENILNEVFRNTNLKGKKTFSTKQDKNKWNI